MSTMMFKVMNLVVKTIAKPIVSYVTQYKKIMFKEESQSKVQNFIRRKLISTGRTWNYYNVLINRKLFKISTGHATIAELSEDKALERGAEIIGEFLVYSLLIIVPVMEWIRLSKIAKKKEIKKQQFLEETKLLIGEVKRESEQIDKEINDVKYIVEDIEIKLSSSKALKANNI